jgi:hypothetical protein
MRSITRHLLPVVVLAGLAPLPLACGGTGELHTIAPPSGSYARVTVAYVHRHGAPAHQDELEAEAQFVSYSNAEAPAVAALLGQPPEPTRRGECRIIDRRARSEHAGATAGPDVEIALLDAGDLEVHGPTGRTHLTPRRHPDLVPFVAGVFYAASEPPTLLEPTPAGEVQILGTGGPEIGPFTVTVPFPLEAPALDVNWSAAGLDLRWRSADEEEGVAVEIRDAHGDGSRSLACLTADDGAFVVPAALIQVLAARELQVTATRQRRQSFTADGIDSGEVTLALRDVAELSLPDGEGSAR